MSSVNGQNALPDWGKRGSQRIHEKVLVEGIGPHDTSMGVNGPAQSNRTKKGIEKKDYGKPKQRKVRGERIHDHWDARGCDRMHRENGREGPLHGDARATKASEPATSLHATL